MNEKNITQSSINQTLMDITKLQVELNPIDREVFNVQFRDIETGKVVLELDKAKLCVET